MAPSRPANISDVAASLSTNMIRAMEHKEQELDAELERYDQMKEDDLETLRERRRQTLIAERKAKHDWIQLGHGEVTESTGEMDFFTACKSSPKVIGMFYKSDMNIERCEILLSHLQKIARTNIDIRFLKMEVDRHPFLVSRLRISIIPSMVLIKEQEMLHTMIGFSELGCKDDFTTEELLNVFKARGMNQTFEPTWRNSRTTESF